MSYVMLELLLLLGFADASRAELVFRCPSCSAEHQAACPTLTAENCGEIVREPGCGCCPICARRAGELCGVYTPRCASGLRCYPEPDSELPLDQLVRGLGRCALRADSEPSTLSAELSGESSTHLSILHKFEMYAWIRPFCARIHCTTLIVCTRLAFF